MQTSRVRYKLVLEGRIESIYMMQYNTMNTMQYDTVTFIGVDTYSCEIRMLYIHMCLLSWNMLLFDISDNNR
jgi:hypothetical protein